MAMTTFATVQALLKDFIQNHPNINIARSPHGAFWSASYDDFINGKVPNVQDPNTGNSVPILNKINGKYDGPSSNIVTVLAGTNASFPQMPKGGPYLPSDQIQVISDWISAQCPQ
jgi:hypothetical protein